MKIVTLAILLLGFFSFAQNPCEQAVKKCGYHLQNQEDRDDFEGFEKCMEKRKQMLALDYFLSPGPNDTYAVRCSL